MRSLQLRRRSFLKFAGAAVASNPAAIGQAAGMAWYLRCKRWAWAASREPGDAYEIDWWREQWKRTAVQGLIVDTGDADLFARITDAAHHDGLAVLARIDSEHASVEALRSHPEWFARTARGEPIPAGPGFAPCVHSLFREASLFPAYQEIVRRARPEGFFETGWAGLGRDSICYCASCAKQFRDALGKALPASADWEDPVYRDWIRWGYARRTGIWGTSNRATKAAGGADCLWIGFHAAAPALQSANLRDAHEVADRTPFLLIDNRSRFDGGSFRQNATAGLYHQGLARQNRPVVEIMAMARQGATFFHKTSSPSAEVRLWMVNGIAGGMRPCFYHSGYNSDDHRQYQIAPALFEWYARNERYLINRTPVAMMGVVWSQSNYDFYGRDAAGMLAELPFRGISRAIGAIQNPFLPLHIGDIDLYAASLSALVLPNIGAMSDEECATVRGFVERGGTLIATGVTSLYDQNGEARSDFGLASVFGAHIEGAPPSRMFFVTPTSASFTGAPRGHSGPGPGTLYVPGPYSGPAIAHTYLRLLPELAAKTPGPHNKDEPPASGVRHEVLSGFEDTDIIPFGGFLSPLRVDPGRQVVCTYVPPFPQSPTDEIWMRQPRTDVPGLILGTYGKGRVAFLCADLDRRYGMDPLPDHAALLGNLARWAAGNHPVVAIDGPGRLSSYLYRQEERLILHLVNETGADSQRSLVEELCPVGPIRCKVKLPEGVNGKEVRLLVSGKRATPRKARDLEFEIPQIVDHEVVVIE